MFVCCVVHINHNCQHRCCPDVPPTKCASVRKRKFVPSKSECVPLLHDNSHFLFTVSYFSCDASFSEYSSRLSVKLLSRYHRLRPLTISCLRYTVVVSGIFRQATLVYGARGSLVVMALRYKPAGRGFDSRWCHWNFSVT